MIKELFYQTKEHISWFIDYPSNIFRIIASYCYYLWNGFSYLDIMDLDDTFLRQFEKVMPKFIKEHTNFPIRCRNEETWKNILINFNNNINKLNSDTLDVKQIGMVEKDVENFLHTHFFDLWY